MRRTKKAANKEVSMKTTVARRTKRPDKTSIAGLTTATQSKDQSLSDSTLQSVVKYLKCKEQKGIKPYRNDCLHRRRGSDGLENCHGARAFGGLLLLRNNISYRSPRSRAGIWDKTGNSIRSKT